MHSILQEIENSFEVETVKYKGIQVWPFLRMYISDKLKSNTDPVRFNVNILNNFFRSVTFGFSNWFRQYDVIIFSSSDQRKLIHGKYTDKSADEIAKYFGKSLIIELPVGNHHPGKQNASGFLVSKYFLYFLVFIYEKLFVNAGTIINEKILSEIIEKIQIEFGYQNLIKRHYAQYKVMQLILRFQKPKKAFVVCYYNNMGYIKALKDSGIEVVEIQHGVINESHDAYNISVKLDKNYFPDFLLTFGENEKLVFSGKNIFIKNENVIPVGHFYIDYLSKQNIKDEKLYRIIGNFEKAIAVTSQNIEAESTLIEFLSSAALLNRNYLYIFIPRNFVGGKKHYEFPENIITINWLNTYEIISHCHFHSTMFSTCAIEAPSLGVQNILINLKNYAKLNYGRLLSDPLVTKFVETPLEYVEAIGHFEIQTKEKIIQSNRGNILPEYSVNLKNCMVRLKASRKS